MNGERWEYMRETIAGDLANADSLARSITQGYMPEVYSQNFAYGTYDLERQSGIDTSFTLYSRESMEFLFRENPQILPNPGKKVSKAIAEGKAMRWNKQHVQSVMMQAILQGNSIPDIATRLSNAVCDDNRKAAIRNARTMATGVQNAGRIDSYKRGEEMGIKSTKQWVATLDMRTRHEHRILDGVAVPLDAKFIVDNEEIRYPGDPAASPHLVWNCRCTIISRVAGWKSMAEAHVSTEKIEDAGLDYESWKESRKEIHKPIDDPEKKREAIRAQFIRGYRGYSGPVKEGMDRTLDIDFKNWKPKPEPPKQPTFKDKIDAIRNRIAQYRGTITEADLKEAGGILSSEYYTHNKADIDKLEGLQKKLEEWKEANGYKQYEKVVFDEEGVGYTYDEIRNAQRALNNLHTTPQYKDLVKQIQDAEEVCKGDTRENANWLRSKLSEVREVGTEGFDMKTHLPSSPARRFVADAYELYPKDWVKESVDFSPVKTGFRDRGYYSSYDNEIMLSNGTSDDRAFAIAIHELGHRFEDMVKGIVPVEKEFYDRRTAGESLEWLGGLFRKDEEARKDDFLNPYMGKDYGGSFYELVSMGFQYAYTEPYTLRGDKDMESWIYGILCLL